ncbi:MAG: hypothetical protein PHW73_11815, partial [Atribacterota bacterium]|nr:hypothetical protein [Atribacterota bacterium]
RFSKIPPLSHPSSILNECQSVIVVARRFLLSTFKANSTIPYTIIRNLLSSSIDMHTIGGLSYFLEDNNYLVIPTGAIEPCNYNADLQKKVGLISLKYAAYQAGLGIIGKNTLLITLKYGNMIWLGAILTSAEFESDPIISENPCKDLCTLCISNCPVQALYGNEFMDQQKCWHCALTQKDLNRKVGFPPNRAYGE